MRVLATLPLLLLVASPSARAGESRVRFLTPPSQRDAVEIARDHLRDEQLAQGLRGDELAGWRLKDRYVTAHNRVTHLYLGQRLGGIEVYGGDVTLAVTGEGRLVGLRRRFVLPVHSRGRPALPVLGPEQAVAQAAAALGLTPSEPFVLRETRPGPERASVLGSGGISLDDEIAARLVYVQLRDGELRLAWHFELRLRDERFWWELNVDAVSGEVLTRLNRVRNARYRVFALPLESPDDGSRTLEVDPADSIASPFGWHDVDAAPGAEFTTSRGNNVLAGVKRNPSPVIRLADGGSSLSFDFPLDLSQDPGSYEDAATTNLFYWNNVLHDLHLQYGFDEDAGNFQEIHYGPSSSGAGDAVTTLAQDFSDTNNASMATPADGSSPTMRMHLFSVPIVSLSAPAGLVAFYEAGPADFGPALDATGLTADVRVGLDPADPNGPSTSDACSPLTNAAKVAGRIALVDRGSCNFIDKVDNAETAGAVGVIVASNLPGGISGMSAPPGPVPQIDIPSVLIRQIHGQLFADALAGSETVTATLQQRESDSDLDSTIIVHEFGHGVSGRLTGGPSSPSCLLSGQGAGMGEGWSDFWALALTARPGDAGEDLRHVADYLVGLPGLRNFSYTTDLAQNPQTFVDITMTNQPHGVGEIWTLALWELFWNLVEDLGFDPDFYTGGAGNNVALQLVMDGLKLQPCDPSFVDGRDALLLADLVSYAGSHECRIWLAFAKRGVGFGADPVPDELTGAVTESFALPPACPLCGDASGDGLVDGIDVDLLRLELASPGTLSPAELAACDSRSFSGSCNLLELALLRRGLDDLAPGLEGACAAAP